MSDVNALSSDLLAVAREVGFVLSPALQAELVSFGELLLTWAKVINLTGANSLEELGRRHFIDAVAAAAVLSPGASVVDVGSGGGLPAIPLALLRPDLELTLVEPTAKRVAFLRTAVRSCAIGSRAKVISGRVGPEDEVQVGSWDAAMARAVWSPAEWLQKAQLLVRPQGQILVFCVSREEATALARDVRVVGYARDRWLAVVPLSETAI